MKRKKKIFHTSPWQRIKLLFLTYLVPDWKESLILVTPNTLLEWRKNKFIIFWMLLSRRKKHGRPTTPWDIIKLIRKLAKENSIWGAPSPLPAKSWTPLKARICSLREDGF